MGRVEGQTGAVVVEGRGGEGGLQPQQERLQGPECAAADRSGARMLNP